MKQLLVVAALLAALAAPSIATASDVSMHVQDVPLGGRALAATPWPAHFNMLGLHWRGGGVVMYRTRSLGGAWRPWHPADLDVGSRGWHDGDVDWVGPSASVQFRVHGTIRRLRAYELWSRVTSAPRRTTAEAGTPAIVPRSAWGANEEIVRAKPLVAPVLRLAVVHHTAGTNSYTRAQSAAIVRGIEAYHVLANGWNDIGYNFLVDRYGTIYEGRGGGIERNVIGAHAGGFNAGTTGVSMIGSYSRSAPPKAQQDALVALLAWRLDVAHIYPLGTVLYTSSGNAKYRAGKLVTLRTVVGHRDTGWTECPGARAYALLPALRRRIAVTGLPKLYAPTVLGSLGGPVRFQARLSSSRAWTVTVADRTGRVVATGSGQGALVDWTWASGPAGKGLFTWTISAPGIRVATGTLGTGSPLPAPKLSLTNLAVRPAVIAPRSDGSGDGATFAFVLGAAARVTARVTDAAGAVVADVVDEQRAAGANTIVWPGAGLPDGRYRLLVTAHAGPSVVTKAADLIVDRTLAGLAASAVALSPNGDGVGDSVSISFELSQDVPVRVEVLQLGAVVATPFQGQLGAGTHAIEWDGTANGVPLPDGQYVVLATVSDALGDVQQPLRLSIDTAPPVLTLLDARALMFSLSEPATVTLLVNQATQVEQPAPKGTFTVPFAGPVEQVTATAEDAAGNRSAPVSG
jgi:flagellar hook assembly protein FlgD